MSTEKNSIKRVLLNSSLYSFSSILQKAIGFFLLPLYTAFLSPEEYGISGIVVSLTSVCATVFTLSLNAAVTRFYYDYKEEEKKLAAFWGTIIVFVLVNSVLQAVLLISMREFILTPFIEGVAFYPYILIGILTVTVTPIYTIYKTILQTKQEALNHSVNTLLYFLVAVILNVLFVVVFRWGAAGLLLSSMFTGILFAGLAVIRLLQRKLIVVCFRPEYLKAALKYSLPLLPHSLSGVIAAFVSGVLLNNKVSTASFGVVNLAFQFLNIIQTLQLSVNTAYVPWSFDLMSRGREEHTRLIYFADLVHRSTCVINLAMALFIKEVIQLLINESYLSAWTVIPVMLISCQISGIYYFYVNTLFYNKKAVRYIFLATLSGNLLSIFLSIGLTERLGMMTPAVVLVIEKTLTTTIVYFMSKKFEPVDFKIINMVVYVLVFLGVSGLGLIFDIIHPVGPIRFLVVIYKIIIFGIATFFLMRKDLGTIRITATGLWANFIKK